jgi:hypothetical protein
MNQDFDELVRDSMTRFTDGIDMPPRLVSKARKQHQRRRRASIGWLASGAAVAGAAVVTATALTAGSVAGGPVHRHHHAGSGNQQVQTTAMVISRVDHALATAAAGNPVAYTRETGWGFKIDMVIPDGKPAVVQASVITRWSRGGLEHVQFSTRNGKVMLSTASKTRAGRQVETSVSYSQRLWWRGTYSAPALARPTLGCRLGAIDRTPAQWAREVKKLLSCGAAVAGHQRVDGADAIKLKLSSSYQRACAGTNDGRRCHPQDVGWHGTLWADASTYLPVRLVSRGHHYGFQIDFRWLPPTKANLAMLHQPIPSGFRHV